MLFQRVVDDILDKIESRELYPNARLPSARKMAEQYGVGVMTIQRALRELQQMRITYSVAGKGTFIHPDFAELSADAPLRDALTEAATLHQLGEYLRQQQAILASHGTSARDKTTAGRQLYDHARNHRDLLDRLAKAVTADRVP